MSHLWEKEKGGWGEEKKKRSEGGKRECKRKARKEEGIKIGEKI